MSDTEDVQAASKRRMSDSSSASSADDDSSSMAKKELDNSGFRVDGEPMNKPRKAAAADSDSDSSDSEAGPDAVDDDEEDSTASKSRSAAVAAKSSSDSSSAPPKEADDDDSSSETADDVSKSLDDVVDEDEAPVKVTEEESSLAEDNPPVEVSSPVQVNVVAESDSEGPEEDEEEEEPVKEEEPPVVEEEPEPVPKPRVNGEIKRPQFRHSSSSLSDEEAVPAAAAAVTAAAPRSPSPVEEAAAPPPPVAAARRSPSPVEEPPRSPSPVVQEPADEPVEAVPAVAASPSPVSSSAGLEDRKKEFLQAASSPTPPPAAPASPLPTRANATNLTKIYTGALESNNNNNSSMDKAERVKPAKDITQIYTAGIAKTSTPPASPKPVPARNRDITQLYTGGFNNKVQNNKAAGSPCMTADKLNPQKHNMSTAVDRDAIRQAYEDVRSDTSDTQWAVFKFDESNRLKAAGTGKDFKDFKASFSNEDRGFGYIRINTGDEMSKRAKFVFVTWVGPSVSVMKKAKMSTDKALMKDIIQNMSVELQFENHSEFSQDFFKSQVDKAAGARYGTGERAL